MNGTKPRLLSGNEAVAFASLDAGVVLGTGYPGTPSTEILENFDELGGHAQWSPNEKVALEVGLGAAFGGARTLVTMKHVGVNVAADPLFTGTYIGVTGGLVLVSADDPGMASSQNEQDNRSYAKFAGMPMFEPSDAQEAYEFAYDAFQLSEEWGMPVMLRMTTRICHSKTLVKRSREALAPAATHYVRNIRRRVMIPTHADPAHRRLIQKLEDVAQWNNTSPFVKRIGGTSGLGIITSGITYMHARDAAPDASFLKLGVTYPLPVDAVRAFANSVDRCMVIEEGDPYLAESLRAEGIEVESKDTMYRFGELNVGRVLRILAGDTSPEAAQPKGKAPRFCPGCPHSVSFSALKKMDAIVCGDIGCYMLGVLPPFEHMDTSVCMGASIGVGLGLRHILPEDEAKRVVSIIGDGTFVHSGITGIVEMVYNPPPTGHVVIILDNSITAMTGFQEHPATGRSLDHSPATKLCLEDLLKVLGVKSVQVVDPMADQAKYRDVLEKAFASGELEVIIARNPCVLVEPKLAKWNSTEESCNV